MAQYIVDGRRYDMATAEEIGSDSYGNPNDFSHWEETLYRTTKGAFFVVGGGGPMTRWARQTGENETSGSCGIRVLDAREAMHWCERADIAPEVTGRIFEVQDA